ncbi:hypothetical protein, partial [Kaarinaea lacus]
MSKFYTVVLSIMLMCCFTQAAQAAYIQRTITIDGSMNDWYDTPPTYTPGGDITTNTNPYQYSDDAQTGLGDLDTVGSTGRDLRKFSFTWDATYLYFYVERWASTTNVTDWWFYIDIDADGQMELNEKVFRVNWQGSNQRTTTELWDYIPYDPDTDGDGDPTTNPGS